MRLRQPASARTGTAAVEFAVVLSTVLVPLMLGTWEIGRLVQVQQIMDEAVREGARIAAQGRIINLYGSYTEVVISDTDPAKPDVYSAVKNHLSAAGLNTTGLNVTFTFLNAGGTPVSTPQYPYQGTKGQRFRVIATLPYTSFRWTNAGFFNISQAKSSIDWVCLADDPFTVDTTLPSWTGY
jgi:hypothetical protein